MTPDAALGLMLENAAFVRKVARAAYRQETCPWRRATFRSIAIALSEKNPRLREVFAEYGPRRSKDVVQR